MRNLMVAAVLLSGTAVWAQSGDAGPAFEVAAVKVSVAPMPSSDMHEVDKIQTTPTSLTMSHIRLKSAIKWAWSVSGYQVSGPGWIDGERYDIMAKSGAPVTEAQLRMMLRRLIQERFKLAFHKETKTLQAWELVQAKGGAAKLKDSDGQGEVSFEPGRGMSATIHKMSLWEFAEFLSQPLQAPVLNKTGLEGRYDFALNLTPYMTGDKMGLEDFPGIVSQALQEQVGLKLESRKDPLEVMVIERVEKIPAEN